MQSTQKQSGFTLVELSIVLVIIGLLIGGILGGQELIRASELNSISSDISKYKVSVNAFRLKYNAFPGDMPNATSYWPTAGLTNGDGDFVLDSVEIFPFWKQLNLSGIVPGNYTGAAGVTATDSLIGTNVPETKLTGVGVSVYYFAAQTSSSTNYYEGEYGNVYFVGSDGGTGSITQGPAMTPEDAYALEIKADDGRPGYGIIKSWKSSFNYMSSGVACTSSAAQYNVSATTVACPLIFLMK